MSEISSKGVSLSLIIIHSSYGMCWTTSSEIKIKTFKQKIEVECNNFPIFVSFLVEPIFVSSIGIDCNLPQRFSYLVFVSNIKLH